MRKLIARFSAVLLAAIVAAGMFAPAVVRADDFDDWEWDDIDFFDDDFWNDPDGDWDWHFDDDDDDYDDYFYAYIVATVDDDEISAGDYAIGEASVISNTSGFSQRISWYSSNDDVATVSGTGNRIHVNGKSDGSATITAELYVEGDYVDSDSFRIRVRGGQRHIDVTGIYVNPTSLQMYVGESRHIDSDVRPEHASDKGIAWNSNNEYVATVTQNGDVYARNAGTATIVAKTKENGHTAYINLTVYGGSSGTKPVETVWVNPTSVTMAVGQYQYITANVGPADAANKGVGWSSSNNAVATVSDGGKVTAVAPGNAVITCRTFDGGKTAQTAIVVTGAPASSVGVVPVTSFNTRDPMLNYTVTKQILEAAPGATVAVPSTQPMSYDANVAAAMKMRPDVAVVASFPFQDHTFTMALPAGYDLAAQLDKTGYAEWLYLCTLKNGVVVTMQ